MTNEMILGIAIAVILVLILATTVLRKRPAEPDLEELEKELEQAEEAAKAERPPEEAEEAAEPEGIEEPPAAVEAEEEPASRLARGLAKTRSALASTVKALTGRDNLDEDAWEEIEEALIRADVGMGPTEKLLDALRDQKPDPSELPAALRAELVGALQVGDRSLRVDGDKPTVWLVIGVNGVGKTTSIAKMVNRLREQDRTVVLAAGDTFRAAAIEQLGTWAERLGVHMVKHQSGADPSAVVYDALEHARAKKVDVVIVDTAGRLHTKSNLMDELKKVRRVVEREAGEIGEALLVLDATVGQNGLAQAKAFHEAIGATGVILTKLDGSARGGIVLSVQEQLGIPVKLVGVGEGMHDLQDFVPEDFVDALLDT